MGDEKLAYDELRQRLEQAEAALAALRRGEVDLVMGQASPLLVPVKSPVEEHERLAREWQATFGAVQSAILLTDETYTIIRCNRAAAELFGQPIEQMLGANCYQIVHRQSAPYFACPLQAVCKTNKRQTMVFEQDGRWLEVSVDPVLDAGGILVGTVHVIDDITERKRAEEAADRILVRRQRELEVVAAVASSSNLAQGAVRKLAIELTEMAARTLEVERVGVWLFDESETRLVNVDQFLLSGGGHSSGAVLLQAEFQREFDALKTSKYVDAHDPSTDPRTAGYVEGYLKPNRITSMLDAVIRGGGRNLGTLCFEHVDRPHHWEDDEITFACQLADQTALAIANRARKRAEATLQAERELLRTLIDNMPDYIYAKDTQSRFTVANLAVAQGMGETAPDGLLGKTDADYYPPELAAQYRADEEQILRSGQALVGREEQTVNAAGQRRWFLTTKVPLRDRAGKVAGLVGIGRDITERKQAEAEKDKLQAQLAQAQKMESVGRLAGGVAHEFNNMLGVILGYTQLAQERIGLHHPLHAELDEIRKAAERSADLTRQLLAFARKQTVAPKVLDLNETVEGALKMLRRLIGEDIDLVWLPRGHLGPVFIDPAQVDQILANLCVNARDAIAGVGKVTIETDSVSFDEAYCAGHAGFVPGEFVMLAVSDDGCGMDAETQSRLFDPFFTTKELGRGTGLGLATVHGAVKQNHGFINVYSEPGHGTTFKIYLPRHAVKAALRFEREPAPAPAAGGRTILLVEDEPAVLEMTAMMLEGLGYAVIAAGTPGEAIRLAREHTGRIDLLMTDVVMPEMNGRDLAANLMAIYPDIKRLFMSGYTANVIAHRGVLDPGVQFLQKPFTKKELAAQIREALDRE